jgi:hypothetical protein
MTPWSLEHCEKLGRQLENGLITFAEYAYNVTLAIIAAPDDNLLKAVELIPADVVTQYSQYLETVLQPVDYKPCPMPFLVGRVSAADIEEKKLQLREKYSRLHQLVKGKLGCS